SHRHFPVECLLLFFLNCLVDQLFVYVLVGWAVDDFLGPHHGLDCLFKVDKSSDGALFESGVVSTLVVGIKLCQDSWTLCLL
ncbi:MAG: hypothetical protein ACKO7B_21310, partial [Flavobacteriales bacterium]